MKTLILDDDEFRHEYYTEIYTDHEVSHAWKYSDFCSSLVRGSPWDLIHLDHDLGDLVAGDTYTDGWGKLREFNGQHASQKLCELPDELLPKKVIIQSVNPEGAKSMLQMLQRRGVAVTWQPFSGWAGESLQEMAPSDMEHK